MESKTVAGKDSTLERVLSKTGELSEIIDAKVLDLDKLEHALSPYLRTSFLVQYDDDNKMISGNQVYEMLAPFMTENMKPSEVLSLEEKLAPAVLKNAETEMLNLNAQGASMSDSKPNGYAAGRSIVGLDIRLSEMLSEAPETSFVFEKIGKAFAVKKVISNVYRLSEVDKGAKFFFATDSAGSAGYLLSLDSADEFDISSQNLLSLSFSKDKTDYVKSTSQSRRAARLYEIKDGGQTKRKIPTSSQEFKTIFPALSELQNKLFDTKHRYETRAIEAFLNGGKVDVVGCLKDFRNGLIQNGKVYLKQVKPRLNNGKVEYTNGEIQVSEDFDSFLDKIKVLYGGDKNAAKGDLFLAVPKIPPPKNDISSMYG